MFVHRVCFIFVCWKLRFFAFPPVLRTNWMHLWPWHSCSWWWRSTWLWRFHKDLCRSVCVLTAGRQHLQLSPCCRRSAVSFGFFFFLSLVNDRSWTILFFWQLGANDKVQVWKSVWEATPSVVSLWWNYWCFLPQAGSLPIKYWKWTTF